MEQWKNKIDVQMATDKKFIDFTLFKLWEYNKYKLMDNGLWPFFQDDFEMFGVDIF